MSDAESDGDQQEGFMFQPALVISEPSLRFHTTIQPKFVRDIDGARFVNLDFYQSRGVYSLLVCKVQGISSQSRPVSHVLKTFCNDIRKIRDDTFRQSVRDACVQDKASKFDAGILPKAKRLRVIARAQSEIVHVKLPDVADVDGVDCKCLMTDRKNRHNQLWMELDHCVCTYLVEVVVYKWNNRQSMPDDVDDCEGEAQEQHGEPTHAQNAEPSACNAQEGPAPTDSLPLVGEVEHEPPKKRQSVLSSFFK
jgi:hypothetical protein